MMRGGGTVEHKVRVLVDDDVMVVVQESVEHLQFAIVLIGILLPVVGKIIGAGLAPLHADGVELLAQD